MTEFGDIEPSRTQQRHRLVWIDRACRQKSALGPNVAMAANRKIELNEFGREVLPSFTP